MPEVVFGVIAILATTLYVKEYALRRKIESDSKPKGEDVTNYATIAQLTDKSHELVNETRKDAEKLISEVKEFDVKSTQDFGQSLNSLLETEKRQTEESQKVVTQEFKAQEVKFERFLEDLTDVLENKTDSSINNFNIFLQNLEKQSQNAQVANWEGARAQVSQLFENFETKMADFLLQSEQKMMLSVDLELKSARQLIDTYKVQQMNIIDENIVSMLEKTLSLILGKNLSLKDQTDLVYDSLEKAKTESFLV